MDNSCRTAITRKQASLPARTEIIGALRVFECQSVLDWGCGKGKDVEFYIENGYTAVGYDPAYQPDVIHDEFDMVTCVYVLNVLPPPKRQACLEQMLARVKQGGYFCIAARSPQEIERSKTPLWHPIDDGFMTFTGSFQTGLSALNLIDLVYLVSTNCIVEGTLDTSKFSYIIGRKIQ